MVYKVLCKFFVCRVLISVKLSVLVSLICLFWLSRRNSLSFAFFKALFCWFWTHNKKCLRTLLILTSSEFLLSQNHLFGLFYSGHMDEIFAVSRNISICICHLLFLCRVLDMNRKTSNINLCRCNSFILLTEKEKKLIGLFRLKNR